MDIVDTELKKVLTIELSIFKILLLLYIKVNLYICKILEYLCFTPIYLRIMRKKA